MAVSGLALVLFVIGHMVGNLLIFVGQEEINAYAAFLKGNMKLLWVARIGLIVMVVLHIVTAVRLKLENSKARPQRYKFKSTVQATAASLFMGLSGTVLLFYIVGHLLHFTGGVLQPEYYDLHDAKGRHDVYSMVVLGFQDPLYSVAYIVAMVLLSFHLAHGMASSLQTLGFNHPSATPAIRRATPLIAIGLAAGYSAIPAAVLLNILTVGGA